MVINYEIPRHLFQSQNPHKSELIISLFPKLCCCFCFLYFFFSSLKPSLNILVFGYCLSWWSVWSVSSFDCWVSLFSPGIVSVLVAISEMCVFSIGQRIRWCWWEGGWSEIGGSTHQQPTIPLNVAIYVVSYLSWAFVATKNNKKNIGPLQHLLGQSLALQQKA